VFTYNHGGLLVTEMPGVETLTVVLCAQANKTTYKPPNKAVVTANNKMGKDFVDFMGNPPFARENV